MQDTHDDREYLALVNDEEQYSLWLAELPIPQGWKQAGKRGTRQECLDFIKEAWVDMRPLSLRKLEAAGNDPAAH